MDVLTKAKKSLTAQKGHLNRATRSYDAILKVQPQPTSESLDKAYTRVQKQLDACITSSDQIIYMLEGMDLKETTENIDVDKELSEITTYYDKLLDEQCTIESTFVAMKNNITPQQTTTPTATTTTAAAAVSPAAPSKQPNIRLAAMDPPVWNGSKADFYTWQRKFLHIMEEAHVRDEMTQLCYLQTKHTLPSEYETLISDCSTMGEVWVRLEERVPRETIKFEILSQLRSLKPLTTKNTPTVLRNFANEVSLFCRRMSDIGIEKENYSCIVLQDIFERLDPETSLRYRSKIELKRELLSESSPESTIEADLDSLCKFLRSEATTLELSGKHFQQPDPLKSVNVVQKTTTSKTEQQQQRGTPQTMSHLCVLGCNVSHRLIDCPTYMNFPTLQRKEFIKTSSRCFVCLAAQHVSRNCMRRKSVKCRSCSEDSHHWTLCDKPDNNTSNIASNNIDSNNIPSNNTINPSYPPPLSSQLQHAPYVVPPSPVQAPPFVPATRFVPPIYMNSHAPNQVVNSGPQMAFQQTIESESGEVESFSPMVVAEVEDGFGQWRKANFFLDNGSNASLVRSKYAESLQLLYCGDTQVGFDVAGGGTHLENGAVYKIKVRPLNDLSEGYESLVT